MFRALQCPSSGARQTAVAASGFRMNAEVEVFSAVVGLFTTVWRAPDDGHFNARNMLSSICTTRQYTLRLIVASSWLFYSRSLHIFKVCNSMHHYTVQINQPTRCNNFSSNKLEKLLHLVGWFIWIERSLYIYLFIYIKFIIGKP